MSLVNKQSGFTLIELVIVIAIIAILATLAIPSRTGEITQKRIVESLELVEHFKSPIAGYYYRSNGVFPQDNVAAGMPDSKKIVGNFLQKVEVDDGVLHLYLGQKMPESMHEKIISIRPVYVEDSPASPISWICGYAEVPDGMSAAGENRTDVSNLNLPGRCRG